MRTTLTIDDDLFGILQRTARQRGDSFKTVVNDLIRAGITAVGEGAPPVKRIKIVAKPLGLRPGYDPDKFNQLVDELGTEEFARKHRTK